SGSLHAIPRRYHYHRIARGVHGRAQLRAAHSGHACRFQGNGRLENRAAARPGTARKMVGSLQRPLAQRARRAGQHFQPEPGAGRGTVPSGARAGAIRAIRLSANASVTRSQSPAGFVGQNQSLTTRGASTSYTVGLDAAWELDLWGRVRRTVEANSAGAQASAADLDALRLSIQAELAQNYFQLRALDAQKHLFDDTISAYQRSLTLTQNQYSAGVAAKADVVQAQTQLKSTQAQALDIGVQRAQLEHAIALLVGKPASNFALAVAPLTAVPPELAVGIPSDLLERRPDIAAAERRMAAANAQIGVAKAAYYPSLTLSATGGFQSSTLSNLLTAPSRFWSVGPDLAQTLFDGGLRRAQTDQAIAAYDANVA